MGGAAKRVTWAALVGACAAAVSAGGEARGQIRAEQVLVVYDSRLPESLAVAEYYAGSARVGGGAGGLAGARPGVRVFDLASAGAPVTGGPNVAYSDFVAAIRNPIRAHLTQQRLASRVRVLVLTKGLPHRIVHLSNPNSAIGDFPGSWVGVFQANDANNASVDAELTLLWQDLVPTTGDTGPGTQTLADGCVLNPYWRSGASINTFGNANAQAVKTFSASGMGPVWQPSGSGAVRLTIGDVMLVSRLDGPTVADVRGAIDRAGRVFYDTAASVMLLDGDGRVLDGSGGAMPALNSGPDYALTRTRFAGDGRWATVNVDPPPPPPSVMPSGLVRLDPYAGAGNFFVGPRLTWSGGLVVHEPVVLLASYNGNHQGLPTPLAGLAQEVWAGSFNLPAGAIFNTVESYNGRAFGGLGQIPGIEQGQASTFIAQGGTFAIGNVWEPLADSIADNDRLAQNFILGTLSWAEAAWTSIPGLSWMQVVIGDPLARAQRSSEDLSADGRVTVDDVYAFDALPPGSSLRDINRDGSVTSADRALVERSVRAWERVELASPRN